MEGYKSVEKGKYVKLHWPSDKVVYIARVLDLGVKFSEFDHSSVILKLYAVPCFRLSAREEKKGASKF